MLFHADFALADGRRDATREFCPLGGEVLLYVAPVLIELWRLAGWCLQRFKHPHVNGIR